MIIQTAFKCEVPISKNGLTEIVAVQGPETFQIANITSN